MGKPTSISILIPVRAHDIDFALDRLASRDALALTDAEIIVTDDGSAPDAAAALGAACHERGWRYQRLETADRPFSLARARNAGLAEATGEFVLFDDLDMAYCADFITVLLEELRLLNRIPLDFLSIPVLYLSAASTARLSEAGAIDAIARELVGRMLFEDPRGSDTNTVIEHFAPASAILAIPTAFARAVGGYDERFEGWGGEDRDFVFRLLAANAALPLPADFGATRVGHLADQHSLAGWRALFRLHGEYCARKGIYGFHRFHEQRDWRRGRSNIELAARFAKATGGGVSRVETEEHRALRRSTLFSVYCRQEVGRPSPAPRKPETGRVRARWNKLLRDPRAFFRDSGLPFSNALSRLFKARKDVV